MAIILPSELGEAFSRHNVVIQQKCLSGICRALVTKHKDGFLILVEESLSFDATLEAVKHELYHIMNSDLDRDDPVEDIEDGNLFKMIGYAKHALFSAKKYGDSIGNICHSNTFSKKSSTD